MRDITPKIKAQSINPTQVKVTAGEFEFIIDEPTNAGGTNQGPTPVDYVIGALAGCMNVVAHIVAKEMDIELKSLSFEVEGDLDPARLYGKSYDERAGYKEVRVVANADLGNADNDTKLKWMAAVKDRCPVSDNLANVTPVKIKLIG